MAANKKSYRRGFKTWANSIAIELRKDLGLQPHSPLKSSDLANKLDVALIDPNQIQLLSNECKNELCKGDGSDCWSAVTIPKDPSGHIVIYNPTHSVARHESNIMHELAHILCKHDMQSITSVPGLPLYMRHFPEEQENEAEWLGACLQLPIEGILWALRRDMNNYEIASHFSASLQMVIYRVNISGAKKILQRL